MGQSVSRYLFHLLNFFLYTYICSYEKVCIHSVLRKAEETIPLPVQSQKQKKLICHWDIKYIFPASIYVLLSHFCELALFVMALVVGQLLAKEIKKKA